MAHNPQSYRRVSGFVELDPEVKVQYGSGSRGLFAAYNGREKHIIVQAIRRGMAQKTSVQGTLLKVSITDKAIALLGG